MYLIENFEKLKNVAPEFSIFRGGIPSYRYKLPRIR